MYKFDMLEKLQDAGVDVADELVRAMTSDQTEELLGYLASVWDLEFEDKED